MLTDAVKPRGLYSLQLSARGHSYRTPLPGGGSGEAWQRPDGVVLLRAGDEAGLQLLRFMLALEDDHAEFVRRFRSDPLLGRSIRELHGLRPLRLATVDAGRRSRGLRAADRGASGSRNRAGDPARLR